MVIEVKEHKYTPNGGHEYGKTLLKIERRDPPHTCTGSEANPLNTCKACAYEFTMWDAVMAFQRAIGGNVLFVDGAPQVIQTEPIHA